MTGLECTQTNSFCTYPFMQGYFNTHTCKVLVEIHVTASKLVVSENLMYEQYGYTLHADIYK